MSKNLKCKNNLRVLYLYVLCFIFYYMFRISADIKDAAFCMGVKNSTGSSTFNKMLNLYKTTKSISEKMSIELALGCSTNRTQLEEYVSVFI